MTVTVVTLGPTALGAIAAVPLVLTGLILTRLPPSHLTARFAGAGMAASGWVVFGLTEAVAHVWWLVGLDAFAVAWWVFVAQTMIRALAKEKAA